MSIISHSATIKLQEKLDRFCESEEKIALSNTAPFAERKVFPNYTLPVRMGATFVRQFLTPLLALIETVVRLALVIPVLALSVFFLCHPSVRKADVALLKGVGQSLYAIVGPLHQSIQDLQGEHPYRVNGEKAYLLPKENLPLFKRTNGLLYYKDMYKESHLTNYNVRKSIWDGSKYVEILT